MLEKKIKDSFGICIKFRTKLRIPIFVLFFYEGRFLNKNYNYFFLVQKKPEIKKKQKSKIGIRIFVRNSMQIPKLFLFFF